MKRISTGIPEFDTELEGGYPEGKGILISGDTGSGKTILGLHLIYRACMDNKNCLYIATEETPEDIIMQAESLGMDLRHFYNEGKLVIQRIYEERVHEAIASVKFGNDRPLSSDIVKLKDIIVGINDIVIIDNIGVFTLTMALDVFRAQFDALTCVLSQKGYTTVFIMDETSNRRTEYVAAYSVYGVIKLSRKENPYTNKHERYLEVTKMRNTQIPEEPIRYKIAPEKGIVFLSD